jgi:hypothetical protein
MERWRKAAADDYNRPLPSRPRAAFGLLCNSIGSAETASVEVTTAGPSKLFGRHRKYFLEKRADRAQAEDTQRDEEAVQIDRNR